MKLDNILWKCFAALILILNVSWIGFRYYQIKHFDPDMKAKIAAVEKLEEREENVKASISRLMAKRDQLHAEVMGELAAAFAAKAAATAMHLETEPAAVPASNVNTQFIVLELHLNK